MRQQVRPAGRRWRSPGTIYIMRDLQWQSLSIIEIVAYWTSFICCHSCTQADLFNIWRDDYMISPAEAAAEVHRCFQ